jgi:5'-methylthioadenosine phosphorylase
VSSKIAIIGGTDVERLAEVLRVRAVEVRTAYGTARVHLGEGELADLAFIARQGNGRDGQPQETNYRANLKALEQLDEDRVVATFSVGSINEEIPTGSLVVLDQFIDLSGPTATFHDGASNGPFADLSEPFCIGLRSCLVERARAGGLRVRESGTYACLAGPRLETAAEVRMLRMLGADVAGMTACSETILARELGLHYAAIAVSAYWGAGLRGPVAVDQPAMAGVRSRILPAALDALRASQLPDCACKRQPPVF